MDIAKKLLNLSTITTEEAKAELDEAARKATIAATPLSESLEARARLKSLDPEPGDELVCALLNEVDKLRDNQRPVAFTDDDLPF